MNLNPRWGGVSRLGTYENPDKTARGNVVSDGKPVATCMNEPGTRADSWHKSGTVGSAVVCQQGAGGGHRRQDRSRAAQTSV